MYREYVVLALALLLFCAHGVPCLLAFIRLAFPGPMAFDFESDAIDPDDWDEATRRLVIEVEALGFVPLGVKTEAKGAGPVLRELSFASAELRAFASVHGFDRGHPHVYFFTPFEDGAVVLTSDVPREPVRAPGFIVQGFPRLDLLDRLRRHQGEVRRMTGAGHEAFAEYTRESRLRATRLYYDHPAANSLMTQLKWKALARFAGSLGLVLAAGALVAYRWAR